METYKEYRKRLRLAGALYYGYVSLPGAARYVGMKDRTFLGWADRHKNEIIAVEVHPEAVKCDHCERYFYNRKGLVGHMAIHPGLRILTCRGCRVPLTDENRAKGKRASLQAICAKCSSERTKRYWEKVKDRDTEWRNLQRRKYNLILREQVLDAYGNVCACCGEDTPDFLTVDHINNDGWKHRKVMKGQFYSWLKKNGFPKENLQLLCYNCNYSKGKLGSCPHRWKAKKKGV